MSEREELERIEGILRKVERGEAPSSNGSVGRRVQVSPERTGGQLGLEWFADNDFGTLSASLLCAAREELVGGREELEVLWLLSKAVRRHRSLDNYPMASQMVSFGTGRDYGGRRREREAPDSGWCWTALSDGSCLLAVRGEEGVERLISHRTMANFVESSFGEWREQCGDFGLSFSAPHGSWLAILSEG